MKKLILLSPILLGVVLITNAQFEWQQIPSPVAENLTSVYFIDPVNGFISSEQGTVLKTTDSGSNWQVVFNSATYSFTSTYFTDIDHGWLVGYYDDGFGADSSAILRTTDGGINWEWVNHTFVNRFNEVYFINNNNGWAVGSKGDLNTNCIYHSGDGGVSWSDQTGILIVGAELNGVSFRDDLQGSVCGADGAFFITNSAGSSWAMGISMPVLNLNDIYNFDILNGCIVGDNGTALYTINNWYQYIDQTTNTTENLQAVSGAPGTSFLWAVGDNGTIIYSSNYLLGWTVQESSTTENLNDVQFLSPIVGWAVGKNGTILRFTVMPKIQQNSFNPLSIYPNPNNGSFTVQFPENETFTSLEIFSSTGKKLIQKSLQNRMQLISFTNTELTKGVYFLRLSNKSSTYHQRFVVK